MINPKITLLYNNWAGEKAVKITPLAISGSDRKYFRIVSASKQALGVLNPNARENLAFIEFSKQFLAKGIKVPIIYADDIANNIYLIEDLGDTTLFKFLSQEQIKGGFTKDLLDLYLKIISQLPKIQLIASENLDYSICYPRSDFDKQSMMWDLNYFKYYFLKLSGMSFDEQELEDDFQKFTDYLLKADNKYFLYRDFQSRNIMLKDNDIYFIDYQGGRRGALQYDLASLLYDAKAEIPQDIRNLLLNKYIEELKQYITINEDEFKSYYAGFVIIRILQAMGAYGFRGFYEKKAHFLASIPFAMDNLNYVLKNNIFPIELNTLIPLLKSVAVSEKLKSLGNQSKNLTVQVNSFSYKRGVPVDESGNGGGFVFDCRALPNPGRYEIYQEATGIDLSVIEFLEREDSVNIFFKNVSELVSQSVENYLERNFDSLSINFGCTGGQHRSVYFAEKISRFIKDKYNVKVVLRHREQEMKRL